MTTLIINDETKEGKAFIEYARKLPFVKTIAAKKAPATKTPNKTTLKAMRDAENGNVTKTKNVTDLIKKLNS